MTPDVEWRPVVGHEGAYEVSNDGQVRSVDRMLTFRDGRRRTAKGRILKPWRNGRIGHRAVSLTGKARALVHVLVLEAFVGPRPEGHVCCHGNGDPQDNRVENLRWDSYSENNFDLVRHGTHFQANKIQCPQGHYYTPENTRIYTGRGHTERLCRTCQRDHIRAFKARKKAAAWHT